MPHRSLKVLYYTYDRDSFMDHAYAYKGIVYTSYETTRYKLTIYLYTILSARYTYVREARYVISNSKNFRSIKYDYRFSIADRKVESPVYTACGPTICRYVIKTVYLKLPTPYRSRSLFQWSKTELYWGYPQPGFNPIQRQYKFQAVFTRGKKSQLIVLFKIHLEIIFIFLFRHFIR